MKKCMVLLLCAVLLGGCASRETFETVSDVLAESAVAIPKQIIFSAPRDAVIPVMVSENGDRLYLCGGYSLTEEILPAGDLDGTIRHLSGYSLENVTIIATTDGNMDRYDLTWATTGEEGDQVGRAAILDDGSYHYVLCVLAPADEAGLLRDQWDRVFRTFTAV